MSKQRQSIRIALWILCPLVIGTVIGLSASKLLWNYWWTLPTIHINHEAQPTAIAFFKIWPLLKVEPLASRNEILKNEFKRCAQEQQKECTFGRTLLQTSDVEWTTLPMIKTTSVHSALNSAYRLSETSLLRDGQQGTGIITIYDLQGKPLTLISFETAELHDDTHGHIEILLSGPSQQTSLLDFASYYYDVAGIEFATPRVLVFLGNLITFTVTVLITVIVFFAKRSAKNNEKPGSDLHN